MSQLRIRKFRLSLTTQGGDFGFNCEFFDGLNIIRGDNSAGKSTLLNSLMYGLGMEEIIGGKGNKTLPYALKDFVETPDRTKRKILNSFVYLEIENKENVVVTIRRSIVSEGKDQKLAEIIEGPFLTDEHRNYSVIPTYLHDRGSAQNAQFGFFSYLEKFIGLKLPQVATTSGNETKLYLQTLFSAMFVEQKRGWTDYIANTPYYAIKDVKTKIVEFLLGLEVFENERIKSRLLSEINALQQDWATEKFKLKVISENNLLRITGVSAIADDSFLPNLVTINRFDEKSETTIFEFIDILNSKIEELEKKGSTVREDAPSDLVDSYNEAREEYERLASLADTLKTEGRILESRLKEYVNNQLSIEEDLTKNKVAQKLKKLGAESNFQIANDTCPSCHQSIDDSLLLNETLAQPMDIDDNVKYLESQRKMVIKYISGLEKTAERLKLQEKDVSDKVGDMRMRLVSLKRDLRRFSEISETDIRIKVSLESKKDDALKAIDIIQKSLDSLVQISSQLKGKRIELISVPEQKLSQADFKKVKLFESYFRQYAKKYGYKSARIEDVELNKDTLFPFLSGIELREVNTDIKSDSSASDFVRLIWAYLLSIRVVSNEKNGCHPGLIVFDEPAQHSMAVSSLHEVLKDSSIQIHQQTIVGASFDESDDVFNESVDGLNFHLIRLEDKLLKPIN